MTEPWTTPIPTSYGAISLWQTPTPLGGLTCYLFLVGSGEDQTVVGYLTVEDPNRLDPELRRPHDPQDRRIDTIWVHPLARGHQIGRIVGKVAKEHQLFESHSPNRTPQGTAWANSIGDTPPPAESGPNPDDFERGARTYYELIFRTYPSLRRLGEA